MFAEHAATFLADFGDTVTWSPSTGGATVTGLMIVDQPDEVLDGDTISRQYLVTFETSAWPGLKRSEQITVQHPAGAITYRLRADPRAAEDGVFSTAGLSKV